MKHILISFLFAVSAFALPVLSPDSQTVSPSDPRIGQFVYAYPNTLWTVWLNDNPLGSLNNDNDFNDAVIQIRFNGSNRLKATWIGANSAWFNTVTVEGLDLNALILNPVIINTPFTVGHQLDITAYSQHGHQYYIGTASFLVDGPDVPEPSTIGFMALGLALVATGVIRKR
jgi:hypothetical protein